MTKLATLTLSGFQAMGDLKPSRTLHCKDFSVFYSLVIGWNGVLCYESRKSSWKSFISKGLGGQR